MKSKCCKAEAKEYGIPDFIGSDDICTVSMKCMKCGEYCDVIFEKRKIGKENIVVFIFTLFIMFSFLGGMYAFGLFLFNLFY